MSIRAQRAVVTCVVALAAGLPGVSWELLNAESGQPLPVCAEDDIIVGTGDFKDGTWTGYTCSHPDILSR